MLRLRSRSLVTASAITVIALGGVLVVASPAAAVTLDPSPLTELAWPVVDGQTVDAIVVSPDGTMWASETGPLSASILAFAPGSTGTPTPEYDITGDDTGLQFPNGMAIDSSGDLWVADAGAQAVYEYAPGSNGDAPPIDAIYTQPGRVGGVAIGPDGTIYVAFGTSVLEYAAHSSGLATPFNTIQGLTDASGIALQANGTIVVGESSNGSSAIDTFAANATGNATPLYQIQGPATQLNSGFPATIGLDAAGDIYFSNYNNITEYPQDATGNVAPTTTIFGPNSGLFNVESVAVGSSGNVYVGQLPDGPNPNTITEFAPLLTVTSVTPNSGPVTGGETVTIHGTSFVAAAMGVEFGGREATGVQVVNSTTITAIVPAGAAVGAVDVVVTENENGQTATLPDGYTYTPSLATTGVDPTPGVAGGAILLGIGGILLIVRRRLGKRRLAVR